jgi:hypothetical protein
MKVILITTLIDKTILDGNATSPTIYNNPATNTTISKDYAGKPNSNENATTVLPAPALLSWGMVENLWLYWTATFIGT